ncbi:MAG TPA: NAD(P)-dependent oxidoreductase [Bacteroidales bacterium]|nr:NAD(P)-dependent oxidoreductase [Bacteroidales bacterium]
MIHQVKNVFIAGGTGFLGYFSALKFFETGANVSTIALDENINERKWFPHDINLTTGNLFDMSSDEVYALFFGKNYDTFVYALGPDDRITPKRPAFKYFYEYLVLQCKKICEAAKRAGVRRCIILNSYFCYFDRLKNGKLSRNHPYIKARREQADSILELEEDGIFDVMIIELPYIFGQMPEREPIWKKVFVERFRKLPAIYFPDGGTATIHVLAVAECVVAAAYNGKSREKYLPATENIKYREMITYMMALAGYPKKFRKLPVCIAYLGGLYMEIRDKLCGKQSGLHLAKIMRDILSKDLYVDCEKYKIELNYLELGFTANHDVRFGIREAIKRAYPDTYVNECE